MLIINNTVLKNIINPSCFMEVVLIFLLNNHLKINMDIRVDTLKVIRKKTLYAPTRKNKIIKKFIIIPPLL